MAEVIIQKFMTENGLGVVDYNSLANKPEKITVDEALSSTSTNPVQNKVVNTEIDNLNTKIESAKKDILDGLADGTYGTGTAGNSAQLGGHTPDYYATLDTQGISTYTHSKSGTIHNFVGTGENGKVKMTADILSGDSFTVNGESVNAYCGPESASSAMAGESYNGKWLTFTYDGAQLNFKGGGGLGSTKLAATTATAEDVLSGKTFYSGNKTLKTGTMPNRGTAQWAGHIAQGFTDENEYIAFRNIPEGAYFANGTDYGPEIRANKSDVIDFLGGTKDAESKTITPSGSSQTYTFTTSGKYCTGNMTVTVPAAGCYSMRVINGNCDGNTHIVNLDLTDGAGTYSICIVHTSFYGGSDGTTYYINLLGKQIASEGGSAQGAATWGPETRSITSSNCTIEYKWPNGNITITYVRIK